MADRETAHQIRGLVARAQVTGLDDSGAAQTASVKVYEGVERTEVEVVQQFGFSSKAADGGGGILLAVGGDQGDLVMLPAGDPGSRMGGVKAGESVMYNARGDRVHLKEDGTISITSGKATNIEVNGVTIEADGATKRVRCMASDGGPRFVASEDYVKLSAFGKAISITAAGIFSTQPIVIGPEPDPGA